MDYKSIAEQAEQYARNYFDTHEDDHLLYHNLYHTERVAKAVRQIGQHYQLNDTDYFIVRTAAWFHDIGYLKGGAAGHEERGAQMAAAFLSGTGVEATTIEGVRKCILATQLPQRAVSLTEQIVCDADLFHLGTDEFGERNKLLRKEAEAVSGHRISKEEWRQSTIRLLEGHRYYTDYCRLLLEEKQRENLAELRQKEEEHRRHGGGGGGDGEKGHGGAGGGRSGDGDGGRSGDGDMGGTAGGGPVAGSGQGAGGGGWKSGLAEAPAAGGRSVTGAGAGSGGSGKGKKTEPIRSVDTVFRIVSNNNQRLSQQADSKAHILIQVNSIIISVLLSLLLRRIEDHTNLAIPSVMLLAVNLVTIIFSILATRPHVPEGKFSKADVDSRKVNLLFFGNFYRMSLEDYSAGMQDLIGDRDFLYSSLVRDVYSQGIALGRKYRWLRWSYNVFMYGLIASVTAFTIAALIFHGK